MNEDELRQLLQQADQDAGPPPHAPPDLLRRIEQAASHQRRMRFAGRSATVALLLIIGAAMLSRHYDAAGKPRIQQTITARDANRNQEIAQLRAELDHLQQQVERSMRTIQIIRANQRRRESLAELREIMSRPDPSESLRRQTERTALILLYQADQTYRQGNRPQAAVDDYREIITHFGQTHAADLARQRLAEIKTKNGGVS